MAQAIRTSRFSGRFVDPHHISRSDLSDHPRRFRGRHHAATIIVVALLAVVGFRAFPQQEVTVLTNGQAYRVSATFDAESEGLAAADVTLNPGDRVLSDTGGKHSSVAVQRARSVTIQIDGQEVSLRTQASTVGGALADAGLDLHPGDAVYLAGQLTTERGPLDAGSLVARPVGSALVGTMAKTSDTAQIAVVRALPVTVVVDTLPVETTSAAKDVSGLLADLGMTVREGDLVRPGLLTPVTAGMTVRLAKARTISVRIDGKDQQLYTQAQTVDDVVNVLGLELGADDTLSLPGDTLIQNGMSLTISRTIVADEDETSPIQPTTVYETDSSLAAGEVRIIPGVEGVQVSHYRATYRDGQLQGDKEFLSSSVTQNPVPTRHIEGTKGSSRPILNAPGYTGTYTRKMTVDSTWYNARGGDKSPGDAGYGITFTGAVLNIGICAVDPNVIPLGTRFYVDGYGPCVAADTGGLIKGNKIDLGYPDSAGDPGWGHHPVDIYILD
ncbi:MAG: ubiquitin-like domain-containing protein [Tepidiformaceae bacterium]